MTAAPAMSRAAMSRPKRQHRGTRQTQRHELRRAVVAHRFGRPERIGWIEPLSDGPDLTVPTTWRTKIAFRDVLAQQGHTLCYGDRMVLAIEPYRPSLPSQRREDEDLLGIPECWTPDIVREWLRDALWTMRAMKTDGPDPAAAGAHMPDVIHEWESYGSEAMITRVEEAAKLLPTREQIARMDMVLPDWLLLLPDYTERWCVLGVGLGYSLRFVAERFGLSHQWAREVQERGFAEIARRLNAGGC